MAKTPSDDNGRRKAVKQTLTESKVEKLTGWRDGMPIWVRAPNRGPEKFSGLTRPYLYLLVDQGLIISRCVTQPGKVRGCRLFNLQSILEYIEKSGKGDV